MDESENTSVFSEFPTLLHPRERFLARVVAVLRFDGEIYAEIEQDPHATPQAFAVVIGTAVLAGFGQGSPAAIFLGIAVAALVWALATALVWCVGVLLIGPTSEFPPLLRSLGFAYVWFGLLIGASLPYVGLLVGWAGVLLYLGSLVLATRQAFQTSTGRAALISGVALGIPLLILFWVVG